MNKSSLIYVSGHTGFVGSAIVRELRKRGYDNLLLRTHTCLDLSKWQSTEYSHARGHDQWLHLFERYRPDYVFHCAGKVGGIVSNEADRAGYLHANIAISFNVIENAYRYGVKKLLNFGSSCIYPRNAPQPIREDSLLTSALEPTNEGYALAKIAALKLCQYHNEEHGTNFLSVMPCNLYGEGDRSTHVIPDLIRKFREAKEFQRPVICYGDGSPTREFLWVDDCAAACVSLMEQCDVKDTGECVNIGSGEEVSIRQLVEMLMEQMACGYSGVHWDTLRPNGTPRKVLDCSKLHRLLPDWKPRVKLAEGLAKIVTG